MAAYDAVHTEYISIFESGRSDRLLVQYTDIDLMGIYVKSHQWCVPFDHPIYKQPSICGEHTVNFRSIDRPREKSDHLNCIYLTIRIISMHIVTSYDILLWF